MVTGLNSELISCFHFKIPVCISIFVSNVGSGPHGLEIVDNILYACSGGRLKGYDLDNGNQVLNFNHNNTFRVEDNMIRISYDDYNTFNEVLSNSGKKKKILPNTPFLEWHYIKNNFFLNQINY